MSAMDVTQFTRIDIRYTSKGSGRIFNDSEGKVVKVPETIGKMQRIVYREAVLNFAHSKRTELFKYFEVENSTLYSAFFGKTIKIITIDTLFSTGDHKSRLDCYRDFAYLIESFSGETVGCNSSFTDMFAPTVKAGYPRAV